MALLRTLAIVLIAAAVFHLLMYLWLRSLHRERLEQAIWGEDPPDGMPWPHPLG